jgi:C1A family cysteine protease
MKFALVLVAPAAAVPSYQEWQQMYGKNGGDREAVYNANAARIDALNAQGGAVFDVNEFADLTLDEWKEARGVNAFKSLQAEVGKEPCDGCSPDQCDFEKAETSLASAVDDIDWVAAGAVTPVKDQGAYGTCGYFSSIAVMEGLNVVQGGNELVSLSEQEVLDCCTPTKGCNGWPGEEIAWYSHDGGVFAKTEESYPYKGASSIPMPDGTPCGTGTSTKATSAGSLCVKNDPDQVKAHLKELGPAVWMIDATCLQFYSSGVISQSSCAGNGGTYPHYNGIDHATTLVGSGTENGVAYWKVKNSWGQGWGEGGYYRVKQDTAGETKPMLSAIGAVFGTFPKSVTV